MSIDAINAMKAYGQMAKAGQAANRPDPVSVTPDPKQFQSLMGESLQNTVDLGRNVDRGVMDMARGQAGMVELVDALARTEVTIQTLKSFRDGAINAYNEVMRMPI
jgi:flagellar hook-basal body complex protein FliE